MENLIYPLEDEEGGGRNFLVWCWELPSRRFNADCFVSSKKSIRCDVEISYDHVLLDLRLTLLRSVD